MAVDLGSTMIDSCLIDAEDKDVLAQRSTKNPQRLYGSDVINRILTVKRDARSDGRCDRGTAAGNA